MASHWKDLTHISGLFCLVGFHMATEGTYTELFFLFTSMWNVNTALHKNIDPDTHHVHDHCSSLAGCPYDLGLREVRKSSLVLLWAAPLYEGSSPVTGYFLEISEGDQSDDWTALNEKPISDTHHKVSKFASFSSR